MGHLRAVEFLASRAAPVEYEQLPAKVVRASKLAILDCLGVALAGTSETAPRLLAAAVGLDDGPHRATVIGRFARSGPLAAALVNGALGHVLDFDDTYLPAIYHGTSPALAAALAAVEQVDGSGRLLVAAHVAGYEVGAAVAAALYPDHVQKGWHVTATAGTLGACAAAGRALGLGPSELAGAYGLAATQAAGLRAMLGTMAKCLHVGKAAANGLLAALLASRGFESDREALDGAGGFFDALGGGPGAVARLAMSGDDLLAQNTIKAYPCAILIHPAIRAALALRERDRVVPEAIESVTAVVCADVPLLVGKTAPATGLAAKFSTSYCIAVALLRGSPRTSDFTDTAVCDPRLAALESRVRLEAHPGMAKDQACVRVRFRDGSVLEEEWRGGLSATEAECQEKFLHLAAPVLGRHSAQELLDLVPSLERLPHLAPITSLLRARVRTEEAD